MIRTALLFIVAAGGTVLSASAAAQDFAVAPNSSDDVAAPIPPAVITRNDSRTRATLRAVRLTSPLRVDGRLEEDIYRIVPAISDFVQMEPVAGEPTTEQTDVWVLFDSDSIYIIGRCWDSHPEREVADEMRRDSTRIPGNENFAFTLDTFHDRRSGYNFEINPLGGRWDGEIIDDGAILNPNFNPVWELATGRFENGWVVETRVPFKSLIYSAGTSQVWGLQVRRIIRWKNEITFLTRIPPALTERAHTKVSVSATLIGLEVPPAGRRFEIKPYGISTLATDSTSRPHITNKLNGDWGADLKYGISRGLTADFTYNTDFAQVEADLQQVNLTRFSLFFPEKRDFFLENSGAFTFGATTNGATGSSANTDNTPSIFYSRRIGLAGSQVVPVVAGGRLAGRIGRFSIGVVSMEADRQMMAHVAATNFSVVRLKRDILRRSSVGAIFTNRSVDETGIGTNQAYGFDGQFLLTNTLLLNMYWARTRTSGRSADDTSYKAQFDYEGDRYGLLLEHLAVGADFNPEIGFVRHPDVHRSYVQARFSPRPRKGNKTVRKFYYNGTWEYIENGAGRVDTRTATGEFAIDFQNSSRFNLKYFHTYEFLPAPLLLAPAVVVPVGGYQYESVLTGYNIGRSRKRGTVSLSLERGSFYSGHKTTFNVANGLLGLPPHVILEPTYSFNEVHVLQGSLTTHLLGPRLTFMATPRMFVSVLVQYNSTIHNLSSNVRFRWEYQPGSELFVVWNEQRNTAAQGVTSLQNRALIVKVNRLFRF